MPDRRRVYAITAAVLLCAGCSSQPAIGVVEGELKLDGRPVAGALVLFQPEGPLQIQSGGVTDEQGRFKLRSNDSREGALIGPHKVIVQSAARFSVIPNKEADDATPVASANAPEIPEQYTKIDRTQLRQEVVAGENSIVLELLSGKATEHPAEP